MNTITHHSLAVQPTAIACYTLQAFLSQLSTATVMSCILSRDYAGPRGWVNEQAVHLTALNSQRLICFVTVLATQVCLNELGRLTMISPLHEQEITPQNGSLLTSIVNELGSHLQMIIKEDPRVFSFLHDCRYTLPSDLIWSVRTNVPLHYRDGQWHPAYH